MVCEDPWYFDENQGPGNLYGLIHFNSIRPACALELGLRRVIGSPTTRLTVLLDHASHLATLFFFHTFKNRSSFSAFLFCRAPVVE